MSTRPDWTEFWFTQALIYSTRGTCDRLRTACLLVKDKKLISAGYNGSAKGADHCDDVGHLIIDGHCERTLHAEENAVINAKTDLTGATAYVIGTPCIRCARILINAGIKEIHSLGIYENSRGKDFLSDLERQTGVIFVTHNLDPKTLLENATTRLLQPGGAIYRHNRL